MLWCCDVVEGKELEVREVVQVPTVEPPAPKVVKEEQPLTPTTFRIEVEKNGAPLGLLFDFTGAGLQVCELHEGAIQTYNKSVPEDEQVRRCDFITAVNGERQNQDMFDVLQATGKLNILVVRPARFALELSRGVEALGIELACDSHHGVCLEIEYVLDGAVQEYNSRVPPVWQVKEHDFIEVVNGIQRVPELMLDHLHRCRKLELRLLRVKHEDEEAETAVPSVPTTPQGSASSEGA